LVRELVELGLVTEEEASSPRQRGRPSPMVTAHTGPAVLSINPDIDAVLLGVVGLGGVVHRKVRIDTPGSLEVDEALHHIRETVADLTSAHTIMGAGVAVPGLVRSADGTVTRAPHLQWRDVPLQQLVTEQLGVPSLVGNDAQLAMVAESVFGAGRGHSDMVYLNGSASGIGGGALVGGVPLRGAQGFAGELGHTLVTSQGEQCHCGRRGCLETEVNVQRLLDAAGLDNRHPSVFLDHLPTPSTPSLEAELDRQADVLGHGIANLISVFNPHVVVLGGYLSTLYAARHTRVLDAVTADAFAPLADDVTIERAQLGENLLLVGAAELAWGPLLLDPAQVSSQA
jgi:predicted NBD/HSP70 family sugar kinase